MPIASSSSSNRSPARLDDFCISARHEVEGWLRQLLDRQLRLQLGTPAGHQLSTRLWGMDPERASLSFEVRAHDPQLAAILDSPEVVAVAYLDNVRLEFELEGLVLVQGLEHSTLRSAWPALLYRFQRRQTYRVQPLGSGYPRVSLQHPQWPELALSLRVLDLSVGGLALLLPPEAPAIAPGQTLPGCRIELDRDIHFEAPLRLQHVSAASSGEDTPASGQRLGCAFGLLPAGAERALQLYIDQTQKRQRLLKKP